MSADSALPREGQTFAGSSLLSRYASFVKLPHTLFPLPFAGVGAVLASYTHGNRLHAITALWIVLAFTAARFAAMGFNRIVDRAHDAVNPRTRLRELPAGKLTLTQAIASVVVASGVFVFSAWQLNELCGWLSPVALAWVFFYSYTKRFSDLSHLVLGMSLGIAPVGAYLAITGAWSDPWWALPVLAAAVMLWVAGFDIVYAIQDIDFDRAQHLHSLPARLGAQRSLLLARLFHMASVATFLAILVFQIFPVGLFYAIAVGFMGGLLMYEHLVVSGGKLDLPRIDRAFFKVNVIVSTSFFLLTLLDRVFRG